MRWPYWGSSGEVPEEVGQLCEECFQRTAWKGTHNDMNNYYILIDDKTTPKHAKLYIRSVLNHKRPQHNPLCAQVTNVTT